MDPWKIIGTIAGSFIIVYGIQGAWILAQQIAERKVRAEYEAMNNGVKPGRKGDPVIIEANGVKFKIAFEQIMEG